MLKRKILGIWRSFTETTENKEEITIEYMLSTLKKESPYCRLPEKILTKEIADFLSS